MEIGLYAFADVAQGMSAGQRLRNFVEKMELADQVGLDVFGVGKYPNLSMAAPDPATQSGSPAQGR